MRPWRTGPWKRSLMRTCQLQIPSRKCRIVQRLGRVLPNLTSSRVPGKKLLWAQQRHWGHAPERSGSTTRQRCAVALPTSTSTTIPRWAPMGRRSLTASWRPVKRNTQCSSRISEASRPRASTFSLRRALAARITTAAPQPTCTVTRAEQMSTTPVCWWWPKRSKSSPPTRRAAGIAARAMAKVCRACWRRPSCILVH